MARNEKIAGARISDGAYDAIEAAAFVRRVTIQAVLRPVIEAFAAELRGDPAVQAALVARAGVDADSGATVTQLETNLSQD
jgi:hypothetical protein